MRTYRVTYFNQETEEIEAKSYEMRGESVTFFDDQHHYVKRLPVKRVSVVLIVKMDAEMEARTPSPGS